MCICHICMSLCTYICLCVHTCIYIYMSVYIYIYVCVCIYMFVCIYLHLKRSPHKRLGCRWNSHKHLWKYMYAYFILYMYEYLFHSYMYEYFTLNLCRMYACKYVCMHVNSAVLDTFTTMKSHWFLCIYACMYMHTYVCILIHARCPVVSVTCVYVYIHMCMYAQSNMYNGLLHLQKNNKYVGNAYINLIYRLRISILHTRSAYKSYT
jgi:hypothetical protein